MRCVASVVALYCASGALARAPQVFEPRRFVELRKQSFWRQVHSTESIGMGLFYTLNVFFIQFYLGARLTGSRVRVLGFQGSARPAHSLRPRAPLPPARALATPAARAGCPVWRGGRLTRACCAGNRNHQAAAAAQGRLRLHVHQPGQHPAHGRHPVHRNHRLAAGQEGAPRGR